MTFRATDIKPIGWDMQGSPKVDPATGELAGKWLNGEPLARGQVDEPDEGQIKRYITCWEQVRQEVRAAPDDDIDIITRVRAKLTDGLVDLGFPREMLEQLPHRTFRALSTHVYEDVVEGESSGAARA